MIEVVSGIKKPRNEQGLKTGKKKEKMPGVQLTRDFATFALKNV